MRTRVLIAACAVLAGGCGGGGSALREDSPSSDPVTASAVDDYQIGAGDVLQIFVWREPDLSVTVPVRPDGKITTPLVDNIVAAGKTPSQLAAEIEQALSEYVRAPEVNVILQESVGAFGGQVRVLGQATQPRAVPYREHMTLIDVMLEAGGLTEFAAGNRARVIRQIDGESREIRVRLDDLLNRGDVSQNLAMRPGDVVIIPEAVF